jgi:hypothetical protein
MAHARRNFVELHQANKSVLVLMALELMGQLYGIEREVVHAQVAAGPLS